MQLPFCEHLRTEISWRVSTRINRGVGSWQTQSKMIQCLFTCTFGWRMKMFTNLSFVKIVLLRPFAAPSLIRFDVLCQYGSVDATHYAESGSLRRQQLRNSLSSTWDHWKPRASFSFIFGFFNESEVKQFCYKIDCSCDCFFQHFMFIIEHFFGWVALVGATSVRCCQQEATGSISNCILPCLMSGQFFLWRRPPSLHAV